MMKDIKIKYTPSELGKYAKSAILSLVTGLFSIVWAVILLLINIARWCSSKLFEAVRKKPILSVSITFAVMLIVAVVVHHQMKVKLTTAQWQRDSLEQRLDSIQILDKGNTTYFRYHAED